MSEHQVKLHEATVGVLQGARDLVTDPAHWTTRALARRASGAETTPTDRDAVCWCAIGAMSHAARENIHVDLSQPLGPLGPMETLRWDAQYRAHMAFEEACHKLYGSSIASYVNDNFGHASVLAGFDAAIAKLQSCKV